MSKADEGEIVEEEESGDEDDMGKYMFGSDDEEEKPEVTPEVKPEQKPEVKSEEQKPIQSLREVRNHMLRSLCSSSKCYIQLVSMKSIFEPM